MRQVAQIMGMPVSIDLPAATDPVVFESIFNRLRQIDKAYSPYKADSLVSRFAQDENIKTTAEFRRIFNACQRYQQITDGYFSAYYNRQYDPSGYVKGWAIAEAGRIAERFGHKNYLINIAGDIVARSNQQPWKVAIQHPLNKLDILGTIEGDNFAIATSGNTERGLHIFDPHQRRPVGQVLSVTVIGTDIIETDVFATAVFAMGIDKGRRFLDSRPDYKFLFVDKDSQLIT